MTQEQLEQRRGALSKANRVRTARAAIKRQLTDGELTLDALLQNPPPVIHNATIGDVLEWAPGIGKWRAGRILATGAGSPGVGKNTLIEHLSPASVQRVIARYEEFVPFRYFQTA